MMMAMKNKSFGFSFTKLMFLICIAAWVSVHGQLQTGFISIDCGGPVNFQYVDIDTGISYSTDEDYIETGINRNISSKYAYPNNLNLPQPLSDLRSFPQGDKNCYTLKLRDGAGSLNLIRASFLYGDYDGLDSPPQFDLYLDASLWATVKLRNSSDVFTTETIRFASSDSVYVCLVNTGNGVPFISGLEFRPVNKSIYATENGQFDSLVLFERLNVGSSNSSNRYRDDIYDRIWPSYLKPTWDQINTSMSINTNQNGYKTPFEVIRTAARPKNGTNSLELTWVSSDANDQFYIFLYFAEVEVLQRNQTRNFSISWNGSPLLGPFSPRYLYAATLANPKALLGNNHRISINKTDDSTLPPILNAVEIYKAIPVKEFLTNAEDANAIYSVKSAYRIGKNWAADPCGPKNLSWEGLACNYSNSAPPRIIHLNLSSSGLSSTISSAFTKLSSLESLDLSNNSLSGPIPTLDQLKFLKFLNLKGNQLSGSIPEALMKRSQEGSLALSVDNQNLCGSDSCKGKKNVLVPIIVPLSVALALLIALIFLLKWRRKRIAERDQPDKSSHILSWELRLRIAIDSAQGLGYLHHGCKPPIIHRDVKTTNILLGDNMEAKIADFGLSKVVPTNDSSNLRAAVVGTTGYLDPEYYVTGRMNEKSDVYSFGVVLMELITGQSAIIKGVERIHILEYMTPFLERNDIRGLVDERLKGEFDSNSIGRALDIAIACAASRSMERPSMSVVLSELKYCLEMELSSGRERSSRPVEEIHILVPKSHEIFSSTDYSTVTVTSPAPR
ncbi:hypothetical protein SAY87_007061 [Trapa incisa]|uniref:non-specific serine/threonine protein kinase n=1 Tax=Trapa incisa TaxID=236973 RepID=A0AAN7Q0K5_9MYRT|nr:hypothetical protein SAY87_007061 [Trapa incisa]